MDKQIDLGNDPEQAFKDEMDRILQADGVEIEDNESETETEVPAEQSEEDFLEDVEEAEEEDQEELVVKAKTVPKTSKEQEKIIALKRELKEAREMMRTIAESKSAKSAETEKTTLVAKYVEQGFDQDTASNLAEHDIKILNIEKRVIISEFKSENAGLFEKYPDAKRDIEKIISNMNATGLTAEQLCLAMYGENVDSYKNRAVAAVSGTLEQSKSNNSVSNATRSEKTNETNVLSGADRKAKLSFEKSFNLGDLDMKEYLRLKEQYGL